MKEKLIKLWKGVLYFIWWLFLLITIVTLFYWWNFLAWILAIVFASLILPIVYTKIRDFIYIKSPKLSKVKFLISYILIIFFWYFLSFWILTSWIAEDENKELTQLESITKLNITYSIDKDFTTKDSIDIEIYNENIEKLTINWKNIELKENSITYNYPLELWDNNILILWVNWKVERTSNKSIERITIEQEQTRIEDEKQRLALEAERVELEKQKQLEEQKKQEAEAKQKAIDEINIFIWLVDNFKDNDYSSVRNIELTAILFWSYALTVEKYKNHTDSEIKNLALSLERKTSALQIKQFPIMRKEYTKLVDQTMWEYNIDVYSKWTWNWTIEFVWWYFANNKNKLDTYSTLKEMLKLLRFDRANFKWYEYDDNYTYWEVWGITDNKVISTVK
jgi:hypothetical protein